MESAGRIRRENLRPEILRGHARGQPPPCPEMRLIVCMSRFSVAVINGRIPLIHLFDSISIDFGLYCHLSMLVGTRKYDLVREARL